MDVSEFILKRVDVVKLDAYKTISFFILICTFISIAIIITYLILKNIYYLSTPRCLFLIFFSLSCAFVFGINNFGDKINGK